MLGMSVGHGSVAHGSETGTIPLPLGRELTPDAMRFPRKNARGQRDQYSPAGLVGTNSSLALFLSRSSKIWNTAVVISSAAAFARNEDV